MKELSKALDDFSRLFASLGVEYAVMGGIEELESVLAEPPI